MRYRLLTVLLLLACVMPVKAGLVVTGKRVIYDERTGETSVLIRKTVGHDPSLIQVWLDDGNVEADPQTLSLPFLLTPAVARLEYGRGQSVRVLRTGGGLPEDRESVFGFNVLEIPAAQQMSDMENPLVFSSRLRIKFFYRPRGLRGDPEQAHQALRFSLESGQDGQLRVRVRNPSPYHVTFQTLGLRGGADDTVLAEMGQMQFERMVDPMGELVIPLEPVAASGRQALSGARVHYGIVNDYGGVTEGQRVLN